MLVCFLLAGVGRDLLPEVAQGALLAAMGPLFVAAPIVEPRGRTGWRLTLLLMGVLVLGTVILTVLAPP